MTVFIFIAVLLLLIVGHELGHFFAAKWAKMKVLEFGVGFPPKMFGKKFSEDGTEYTINWLPLGGFVRIFGEDARQAEDPQAFPNRPKLHQAFVLFAGPLANIVIAVVLSTIALMIGTLSIVDADNAQGAQNTSVMIAEVLPASPADEAGIKPGTRIVSVETPEEFSNLVASSEDDVVVTIQYSGEEKEITVTPVTGLIPDDPERRAIGVATALVGTLAYPPHVALWRAVVDTARDLVFIVVSLGTLIGSAFTLSADVSQIAGPVGIATLTGDAASLGFGALLSFAALLSVNLAVINLLPFPALDGGRLLFLGVEVISRKRIPLNIAATVNTVGFVILLLIMFAVTVQDVGRLL
jgi:regulator of sigma E protease